MREHDCQKWYTPSREVWLTKEDDDNFVVVNLPNGNQARILIPNDVQDGETYGLNMVTRGHYR